MMLIQGSGEELMYLQHIVESVLVTLGVIIVGWPLARAIAKRIEGKAPAQLPSSEVTNRLARIEAAVDTMSIEVERMAEAQRFTTKLLVERRNDPPQLPQLPQLPRSPGTEDRGQH